MGRFCGMGLVKKVVLGCGVGTIGFGALFYMVTSIENESDVCRRVGSGNSLSRMAKFFNWMGAKYVSVVGSQPFKLEWEPMLEEIMLDEADLFTELIGKKSFPLKRDEVVASQIALYQSVCDAFNQKENLFSPLGRLLMMEFLKGSWENRSNVIKYVKQHREILQGDSIDERNRLLIVTGLHRTGSTLLQTLLSLDPKARTTFTWEMNTTLPLAQNEQDLYNNERIKKIDQELELSNLFCPNQLQHTREGHFYSGGRPEEDVIITGFENMLVNSYLFDDPIWHTVVRSSSNQRIRCRYLHLVMKLLDSGPTRPSSHWVLKNPDHSQYINALLDEFPEANLIYTHRTPTKVIPSWIALMLSSFHLNLLNDYAYLTPSDKPDKFVGNVYDHMTNASIELVKGRAELKRTKPNQAKRIFDVRFSDLVGNPAGTIQKIYEHFGYEFTDEYKQRIVDHMKNSNAPSSRKLFQYSLESYNLTPQRVNEACSAYM